MLWFLVIIIIFVPIIELWGLIKVGGLIGPLPTIAIVVFTGLLGGWLAKREGLQAYRLAQIQLRNKEIPGEALLDGFCILLGAIMLLTPGFFTDFVGIFFLLPITRAVMKTWVKSWLKKKLDSGNFSFYWFRPRR